MSNVTLKHIADELDISVMTVSRALNNRSNVDKDTRQKVLETAEQLGYRPNQIARSLVTNKTNTIGVVVPEITHSFFPDVIRGIEKITYEAGYQLILTYSMEDYQKEADALSTLEANRVDGIMISTAQTVENYEYYRKLVEGDYPLVFFDRCVHDIGASCVSVNDRESARIATEHLINQGYRRIAHLSGPGRVSIGRLRYNGYKEALENHGLTRNERWEVESGFDEKGGYRAMKELLALPAKESPDAVFAVNDPAAFGAMQAIYDHGYTVPEDIALVGFSDDIRAELMPTPLTTVKQPAYEVGMKAAEQLIKEIEDNENPRQYVVQAELVVRDSTAAASNKKKTTEELN